MTCRKCKFYLLIKSSHVPIKGLCCTTMTDTGWEQWSNWIGGCSNFSPGNLITYCPLVSPRSVKTVWYELHFSYSIPEGLSFFWPKSKWRTGIRDNLPPVPRGGWGEIQALDSISDFKQKPSVACKTCIPHNIGGHSSPNWGATLSQITEWRWSRDSLQSWVNWDPNGVGTWELLQITQMFWKADNIA